MTFCENNAHSAGQDDWKNWFKSILVVHVTMLTYPQGEESFLLRVVHWTAQGLTCRAKLKERVQSCCLDTPSNQPLKSGEHPFPEPLSKPRQQQIDLEIVLQLPSQKTKLNSSYSRSDEM